MNSANVAMIDVQSRPDSRNLPINQVGIKGIKHPICIANRDQTVQHSIGLFEMTVGLPAEVKGTHMSRFVALLNEAETRMSVKDSAHLLDNMLTRLDAIEGKLSASFPFFINKKAPVSGVPSLLDYEVTLTAEIRDQQLSTTLKVIVPITSLCPCSKEISLYGAHNQRSHVTVEVETAGSALWIEDVIELIEAEASSELYGLLKRSDEKYVTERAYDNPKFVEDLVRDIAARLNKLPQVTRYRIESENFESIHNHSAYAMIESSQGLG